MEFNEYPTIEGVNNRNIEFSQLTWITKAKFEHLIQEHKLKNKHLTINPCLNEFSQIDQQIFIGKSIPHAPAPLSTNLNQTQNNIDLFLHNYLELTGSVYCGEDKKWKLKITYQGRSYDIEYNFLVLNIEDPNSYFWQSNIQNSDLFSNYFVFNNKDIPKYAIKTAVDKIDCKYTYIGRTLNEGVDESVLRERPKFYSNAWLRIDEKLKPSFGRVNKTNKLLFAPYKNLEIGFDQFEILCLKPTPASLKVLCRSAIRSYLYYSQIKIKSINQNNQILIPESLINYLKYPSFLKVGESLLKDEKLVDENENYELGYDKETGNLVCRCLKSDDKDQKTCVIAYSIDSIFLHRFHTIFYNSSNSRAITAHSIYDNHLLLPYKFFVDWERPSCQVKIYG